MKKIIFSILAFAAFSSAAQTNHKNNTTKKSVSKKDTVYIPKIYTYNEVEVKPVCDTLLNYLSRNISNAYWFDFSQRHRDVIEILNGKSHLKFKINLQVNIDGSVSNVFVEDMNGVYGENYTELASYIYNCHWKSGEIKGKKVNTLCSVYVSFDTKPEEVKIIPEKKVVTIKKSIETQSSYFFDIDFGARMINYGIIGTYKVSAKNSIMYSIKFGNMISEYSEDIRTDDDKRCSIYSLGIVRHGKPTPLGYCFRYYFTCGMLFAVPESEIKKVKKNYLISNAGIIIDAPRFSYIFGMGGMPIYVNMGMGFNIKNKIK